MSWEVMNVKQIKCLCGNGIIKQEILGDDWNRIEEGTPIIECKKCSEQYRIVSKSFNPKPYHGYTIYYCIDKDTGEEIKIGL